MPDLRPILLAEENPNNVWLTFVALHVSNPVMLDELPPEGVSAHEQ